MTEAGRGDRRAPAMKLASEFLRRRKDNRLIVALVLAVLVVWSAVSVLEQRAAEMDPAVITRSVLLFVLSYLNVTLIAAILFVLGRTLLKLWLDRRHRALGSRFQTKLLATYIGLTAIPIALLFFTATGLLQSSIDRWFSTPVRRVVQQARGIQDRSERRILDDALNRAKDLAARAPADGAAEFAEAYRREHRLDSVELYRSGSRTAVFADSPIPAPLEGDAIRSDGGEKEPFKIEVLPDGSHRYRAGFSDGNRATVVGIRASVAESRALDAIAAAWSDYQKLEVQKPAIKAANVSTFLLITLAILLASIWTGLTLARRITGPIGALAASTSRLRSGDLSARVDVPATDELAVLVESFNRMAAGLEDARGALLRSNADLQDSNRRLDVEKGLFSTVLESVTTGIVAFDADGEVTICNPAARALLRLPAGALTRRTFASRPDLEPLVALVEGARAGAPASTPRDLVLAGDDGERHCEISVRPLSASGPDERTGWVLAIEDTTHVAREQRLAAWSDVARRVAHEIKNPLTPIRLSAERIQRRFRAGDADLPETIEKGTRIIVEEVGFLKSLVNEFSRFARLPQMHPQPTDLPALARSAVRLFEGAREGIAVRVEEHLQRDQVLLDPDQIKRALVNLIDNALESCGETGEIVVRLSDRNGCCTIEVADTGRGVPPRDREKLFLPDFTTKGRGTGLGLAIVYRIVADHRGTIRVEENVPRGARFIIELPAA